MKEKIGNLSFQNYRSTKKKNSCDRSCSWRKQGMGLIY
ncbi:hypothetical protein Gohar_018791 [Gossypium harknessii]|uniref:Uncharacterized protein n=1 Tax=Gossypium harknessii TaxID=34285 RepID=A0A7J9GBG5_9ROSI|nr:hypothetical protein [Gossypium harknessii]